MNNEKVIDKANSLIDEALNLVKDPLTCIRTAIYINGEGTRTLDDVMNLILKMPNLTDEQKYSLIKPIEEMEQKRVDVYVELYNRFLKMTNNENDKN